MRAFADRATAGRQLAPYLQQYRGRTDVLVLGLPRGGVPVAFEVASSLEAPLDVMIVRKLGARRINGSLRSGPLHQAGYW